MIEELHIFGVYMPAALVWAVLAVILTFLLRGLLLRLPLHHILWHSARGDQVPYPTKFVGPR